MVAESLEGEKLLSYRYSDKNKSKSKQAEQRAMRLETNNFNTVNNFSLTDATIRNIVTEGLDPCKVELTKSGHIFI